MYNDSKNIIGDGINNGNITQNQQYYNLLNPINMQQKQASRQHERLPAGLQIDTGLSRNEDINFANIQNITQNQNQSQSLPQPGNLNFDYGRSSELDLLSSFVSGQPGLPINQSSQWPNINFAQPQQVNNIANENIMLKSLSDSTADPFQRSLLIPTIPNTRTDHYKYSPSGMSTSYSNVIPPSKNILSPGDLNSNSILQASALTPPFQVLSHKHLNESNFIPHNNPNDNFSYGLPSHNNETDGQEAGSTTTIWASQLAGADSNARKISISNQQDINFDRNNYSLSRTSNHSIQKTPVKKKSYVCETCHKGLYCFLFLDGRMKY